MSDTIATATQAELAYWNNKIRPTAKAFKALPMVEPKPEETKPPVHQKRMSDIEFYKMMMARDVAKIHKMNTGLKFNFTKSFKEHSIISIVPNTEGLIPIISFIELAVFFFNTNHRITRDDLLSGRRKREFVMARHCIMAMAKKYTSATFPAIGMAIGGRDHSTVCHGIYCVDNNAIGRKGKPGTRDYTHMINPFEKMIRKHISQEETL